MLSIVTLHVLHGLSVAVREQVGFSKTCDAPACVSTTAMTESAFVVDAARPVVIALIVSVAVTKRVPSGFSGTDVGFTVTEGMEGDPTAVVQAPPVLPADGLLQKVIAGTLSSEFALPSDIRIAVNPMYWVPPAVGNVGAPLAPDPGIEPVHVEPFADVSGTVAVVCT